LRVAAFQKPGFWAVFGLSDRKTALMTKVTGHLDFGHGKEPQNVRELRRIQNHFSISM